MLEYYRDYVQPLWPIYMDMRQRGIRVSRGRLEKVQAKLLQERVELEAELLGRIGWNPNTKSYLDMGKLFDQLGITPQRTPTGRPKADDDALRDYAGRWPAARDVLMNVLDITEKRTFVSGFLGLRPDPDEFYHPSYNLDKARTGRSSSEGDDAGGPQLQNIPESLRHIFIPDPGHTFLQFDLKQAEAMYVAYDAEDPVLMQAFETERCVHRYRACLIYRNWVEARLPPDELLDSIRLVCDTCAARGEKKCGHSERQIGKVNGHAFSYKMGPRKQCNILRASGIFITETEAKAIRDKVVSWHIRNWQENVYPQLRQSRWLTNPLGRKREFYGLLDEEMVRAALSWKAQSTVRDVISRAMIHLWRNMPGTARMVTQTHDSVLFSLPETEIPHLLPVIHEATRVPITVHDRTFTIPIEVTVGGSWGEQQEVKL